MTHGKPEIRTAGLCFNQKLDS